MIKYKEMNNDELKSEFELVEKKINEIKELNLSLDMTRGKPCQEQLDLSMGMMDVLSSEAILKGEDGVDCRNYGVLGGIPECKRLLGDIIEVNPENIIIFGNSSLNVMFDCVSNSVSHGIVGCTPWAKLDKVKWLCPVPGYDRHFAITEYFGIEMINIPMTNNGPDMDLVEKYVNNDESVKGIWCVPKYSNPDGTTYSDDVVRRFANLKPKAKDFRIYWDNAYSVHHLYDDNQDFCLEILDECKKAGNPDIVYKFTSTSKISFPGSGIAALAASDNNIKDIKSRLAIQTIGHDKVNQLRHVRFFKDLNGVKEQMRKHAAILRPKFEKVLEILDNEINELGIVQYTRPKGGYFISLTTLPHQASKVINRCKELGLALTPAGSTYPYHKDTYDTNIRLAPSFPKIDEVETATKLLVLVIKEQALKDLIK